MKYVFFGSPEFAAVILEKLIKAGLPPVALVCNPDKPSGRKKIMTPPLTKQLLGQLTIDNKQLTKVEILQPESLDKPFLDKLKSLNADFYIVAAYAKILPKELIQIPPKSVIGIHPSLLPKYRGSSPIQSAILNRDSETGVSLYMMDEKVDHGAVIKTESLELKNQNYEELENELAELAGKMLTDALPRFISGEIKSVEQDESKATYTKKFTTEDGFIDYESIKKAQGGDSRLASEIDAKIRAFLTEPGAYTIKDGKRIKLLKSKIENNSLRITEIQIEGKKPSQIKGGL